MNLPSTPSKTRHNIEHAATKSPTTPTIEIHRPSIHAQPATHSLRLSLNPRLSSLLPLESIPSRHRTPTQLDQKKGLCFGAPLYRHTSRTFSDLVVQSQSPIDQINPSSLHPELLHHRNRNTQVSFMHSFLEKKQNGRGASRNFGLNGEVKKKLMKINKKREDVYCWPSNLSPARRRASSPTVAQLEFYPRKRRKKEKENR